MDFFPTAQGEMRSFVHRSTVVYILTSLFIQFLPMFNTVLKVVSNEKGGGGGVWVVSIDGPLIHQHSADFKNIFKRPRPLKKHKTYLSG